MLNKETKRKIDNARDILVGQLPLPSDQVELITIALIYKFMDDIDEDSRSMGGKATFFTGDLAELSWRSLISNTLGGEERVAKFIRAIERISAAPHIPELFKSIFKNTFLKFRDAKVLKLFMDEINGFTYDHSEELGNAFEYLLNAMGTQGENGQFRTPRNIIDFVVSVVDPKKENTILDPACGTAGFLIAAYKHILKENTSEKNLDKPIHWGDKLSPDEKKKLSSNIVGYDITPLMVRLSKVNMYLHHFPNPTVHEYNTLGYDSRWKEKYDCIIANPPFMSPKGGVETHTRFRIKASKAEVLFTDYILEHLTPDGKAGIIVPEGIIFQSQGDYKELRKWLVNEAGLWAVISLPAGIFQPYSGVKTSVLLVDRRLARERNDIMLLKVEQDGYSLNTNRTETPHKNDLPEAYRILMQFKHEHTVPEGTKVKFTVLDRKEFEKLDSYKAATTGWEFCSKAFTKLQQAQELCNEKLEELKGKKGEEYNIKRAKAKEQLKNSIARFYEVTGFPRSAALERFVPGEGADDLKKYYEHYLKPLCVGYGADKQHTTVQAAEMDEDGKQKAEIRLILANDLRETLDREREYNLSFDKYQEIIEKHSDHPLAKLGDLITLEYGKPLKESDRIPGEYPVYGSNGITGYHNSYLVEAPFLVVGRKGTAGAVHYSGIHGTPIDTTFYIKLRDEQRVRLKYLYYILKVIGLEKLNTQAGVPGLNRNDAYKVEIPFPSILIQDSVINEIEQYQKVIDGCNAVIDNYKPSFKVKDDWARVKLGDILLSAQAGLLRTKEQTNRPEDRIPYIKMDCLQNDGILSFQKLAYTSASIDEKKKYSLANGDILFNVRNSPELVGKTAIYRSEYNLALYNHMLVRLRLDTNQALPEYVNFAFLTQFVQAQLAQIKKGVTSVAAIYQNDLNNVEFPLPSLTIQKKIVHNLNEDLVTIEGCKQLKAKMEAKIKEVIDNVWGVKEIKKEAETISA